MEFREDDRVQFPDPLDDGAITDGRFLSIDVGNPIEVPASGGGSRMVDAAWVAREDGTTARVPHSAIRAA